MRLSGIWSRISKRIRTKQQQKKQTATKLRLENLHLERLEERTLLSVAPPPLVPANPRVIDAAPQPAYNPIVATDPTNPNNIVSVYIQEVPPGLITTHQIRGAFSTNGGLTWTNFAPFFQLTDPETSNQFPSLPFARSSSPSVAWDRQGNFYVVATQHQTNYSVGSLVMSKFNLIGGNLTQVVDTQELQHWFRQEPIYNPVVAIDNNVSEYRDPVTGQTLRDTMVNKAVYVAWNTDTQNPETVSGILRGGRGVRLMASSDGGTTFTTPVWVNDNGTRPGGFQFGPQPTEISAPQILFTQGSMDGDVESGRMIIAYSDGSSVRIDSSRPDGGVIENRVADALRINGPGGAIVDAAQSGGTNSIPTTNTFTVDITAADIDKAWGLITDLDLTLNLRHDNLNQIRIELETPLGDVITLVRNRMDVAGNEPNPTVGLNDDGIPGLGLIDLGGNPPFIIVQDTTFDQQAAIKIQNGRPGTAIPLGTTSSYVGRFRPDAFGNNYDSGGLNVVNGYTRDDMIGTWTLRVIDVRNDGGNPPAVVGSLLNWELHFSSHIDNEYLEDDYAAFGVSTVASSANLNYTNRPGGALTGLAPVVRLAQDTSLGSFSPYQGRVYMTYTGGGSAIRVAYSDTAGIFNDWNPVTVNDDGASDNLNSLGNKIKFTSAIEVDRETGTIVLAWHDARYDASNIRVATMISTSIDGGDTWSRQDRFGNFQTEQFDQASFLNEAKTAVDAITGKRIFIEPIPSNLSIANTPQGPSWSMGLSAHNGKAVVVWAGNRNAAGSDINTNTAYYTAGPRVEQADMGPVVNNFVVDLQDNDGFDYKTITYNNTFHTDGRRRFDSFLITFDRPIDATTFTPADIQVLFRSPNTPASLPGTLIGVAQVLPVNDDRPGGFGVREISAPGQFATVFRVILTTPQTAVGTYSFSISPEVRDRIRKTIPPVTTVAGNVSGTSSPGAAIPDTGVALANTINISGGAAGQVISKVTVGVNITHPSTSDLLLTLVHPDGTRVVLGNRRGGPGHANYNATFNDTAVDSIFDNDTTGQIRPETPLAALIGKAINGAWRLEVTDLATGETGTLNSWSLTISRGTLDLAESLGNSMDQDGDALTGEAISIPDNGPTLTRGINVLRAPGASVFSMTVSVNITHPRTSDLALRLVHPDGTRITLANQRGGVGNANYAATFDDNAAVSVITGVTTGSVQPEQTLATFFGKPINGFWQLEITDLVTGQTGFLESWSMTIFRSFTDTVGITVSNNDNDLFSVPEPTNGIPFQLPYEENTLPLIISGPYVLTTNVFGQAPSADNLALNKTVKFIDVTFDRDINTVTFTPADILRVVGPLGVINGPFGVTPLVGSKRTFRITLPDQVVNGQTYSGQLLNGQYSIVLGPDIQSDLTGERIDTNHNAGLSVLRGGDPNSGQVQSQLFEWPQLPRDIAPGATLNAILNVTESFVIQDVRFGFTMTTPNVQNILATLIAPDGTQVQLFDGAQFEPGANFTGTILDDAADTPIQEALAPFQGTFNPQRALGTFIGKGSRGNWRLVLQNRATQATGTARLQAWSLTFKKIVPGTGLGEPIADQSNVNFRIFTQDPLNPLPQQNWTAVGPIANNGEAKAGQITSVAVDPSDPSGNTVYAAGPRTGIWKTNNFLTTAANGPTWIPLADFGPTNGLSIGHMVVLPRNNDPNRSIILAATGDANTTLAGNAASPGIGFLRSEDGGATWKVLDSLVNYDTSNRYIPLQSATRLRQFDNTIVYKVVVDPALNPVNNENIIYAAMGGTNGGLYQSLDSGKTWQLLRAGEATDIVMPATAQGSSDGTMQQLWAAFRGEGIFFSQNRGLSFTITPATQGRPLIRDGDNFPDDDEIPVSPSISPNGGKGRITLATPAKLNNVLLDFYYHSWVYAIVSTPTGGFDGLYVSKDFGRNWTRVTLPATRLTLLPTNNEEINSLPPPPNGPGGPVELEPTGGNARETLSLAVDPRDPRIVYIGGNTLIRVDLTTLTDPQSFVAYDNSDFVPSAIGTPPSAPTYLGSTGSVNVKPPPPPFEPWRFLGTDVGLFDPFSFEADPGFPIIPTPSDPVNLVTPYYQLSRDPNNPFVALSTIRVTNTVSFNNTGKDIIWNYFDGASSNAQLYYRLSTSLDPLTGQTRLHMATLNGVFTAVDQGNGTFRTDIGAQPIINGNRNGNIQALRIHFGGAQPSQLAADLSGALFYAATTLRGFPQSDADILQTGNLVWKETGPDSGTGDPITSGGGVEVVTDPTGRGFVWKYKYPFRIGTSGGPGGGSDFVQVQRPGFTGTSRTTGLLQAGDNPNTGAGQWPADYSTPLDSEEAQDDDGSQMAINPYNSRTLMISAPQSGRIFRTTNDGLNWFEIGSPAALGNSFALSVAFGSPDPAAQGAALDNFMYAGTMAGRVFVTLNGGATWTDISGGPTAATSLDGSTVRRISPDPVRGSYGLYVLTDRGVYFKADSRNTAAGWENITGNLFNLSTNLFGDATMQDRIIKGDLSSMVADWRFRRPDDPRKPLGPTHPILYVGADGGVFRSLDKGRTWTYFPNNVDGAAFAGGLMPHIRVTDLVLVDGNFNSQTGQRDSNALSSILLATTDGRGAFAIRLEPEAAVGTGPRVEYVRPTNPSLVAPMTEVDVKFDKGVDPTTFSIADIITFTRPDGVAITPLSVTEGPGNDRMLYRVTFAPQTANGVYTIVIGPTLTDFAGNLMNQTPDGVNGQIPSDRFTGRFFRNTTANGPFAPAVIGGLSNGVFVANYSNGVNRYNRQPFWAFLPKRINWNNIEFKDVNGDQKADIIGRAIQTGEWWVSLAVPGGYRSALWATWDTTVNWVNVVTGDFTGDGRWDIAARNAATGDWFVGVSTGIGFRTEKWGNWAPTVPFVDVLVQDYNGDGQMDIAGRNANTGQVFVQVSTGHSFLNQHWATWARTNWADVYWGDYNGDGLFDIVGRERSSGLWQLLQSTGTSFLIRAFGSWTPTVNWTFTRWGDFNNDGRWDVAGWNPVNGAWGVSLSNGTTFGAQQVWTGMNPGNWADVLASDFNGDGRIDLAARLVSTGQWLVMTSNGSRFINRIWTTWSPAVAWQGVRAGDVNADGQLDIVGLNPATGIHQLSLSNGTVFGTSPYSAWMPAAPNWTNHLVGDFNGDGKDDLAYRSPVNGQWYVSVSNGNQAFRTREWARWPVITWNAIVVGDFNNDKKDDIAGFYGAGRNLIVSLSNGSSFSYQVWATLAPGTYTDVRVGDFNGDGLDDLSLRNSFNQVFVARSTGTNFAVSHWTTWSTATWVDVLVGDFNGDGRDDIAARQLGPNFWFVSRSNTTNFSFQHWGTWPPGTWLDTRVADINGDGKDDLVGRNATTGDLWAAIANTAGTVFQTRKVGNWAPTTWLEVFSADMNGDGRDDLIGRAFANGAWMVALSDGTNLNNSFWDNWLANVVLETPRLLRRT